MLFLVIFLTQYTKKNKSPNWIENVNEANEYKTDTGISNVIPENKHNNDKNQHYILCEKF